MHINARLQMPETEAHARQADVQLNLVLKPTRLLRLLEFREDEYSKIPSWSSRFTAVTLEVVPG